MYYTLLSTMYTLSFTIAAMFIWVSLSYIDKTHMRERFRLMGLKVHKYMFMIFNRLGIVKYNDEYNIGIDKYTYYVVNTYLYRPLSLILNVLAGFVEGLQCHESNFVDQTQIDEIILNDSIKSTKSINNDTSTINRNVVHISNTPKIESEYLVNIVDRYIGLTNDRKIDDTYSEYDNDYDTNNNIDNNDNDDNIDNNNNDDSVIDNINENKTDVVTVTDNEDKIINTNNSYVEKGFVINNSMNNNNDIDYDNYDNYEYDIDDNNNNDDINNNIAIINTKKNDFTNSNGNENGGIKDSTINNNVNNNINNSYVEKGFRMNNNDNDYDKYDYDKYDYDKNDYDKYDNYDKYDKYNDYNYDKYDKYDNYNNYDYSNNDLSDEYSQNDTIKITKKSRADNYNNRRIKRIKPKIQPNIKIRFGRKKR